LILGSSPAQTSQAVWWLRDILRPVRSFVPRLEDDLNLNVLDTVRWGYPSLLYNARRGLLPPRQQVAAQGRYYIGRYEPIFREIMFSLAAYIALGTSSWVSAVSEVDAVFHVLSGVLEIP